MSGVQVAEPAAGVLELTIDNPTRRNALDWTVCAQLEAAVSDVTQRTDCRAVIVTGAGEAAFCSGADLGTIFSNLAPSTAEARRRLKSVYRSFLAIHELRVPTIAAVRGVAVGAGVNLAMCCDIVLADPQATFSVPFTRLGLHPGGGASHFLVQAMGFSRALRLILEGGEMSGEEAVRQGVATAVEPDPLAAALSLARAIVRLKPELVADIKHSLRLATRAELNDVVEFESWAQAASTAGNAALAAAAEKHSAPRSDPGRQ